MPQNQFELIAELMRSESHKTMSPSAFKVYMVIADRVQKPPFEWWAKFDYWVEKTGLSANTVAKAFQDLCSEDNPFVRRIPYKEAGRQDSNRYNTYRLLFPFPGYKTPDNSGLSPDEYKRIYDPETPQSPPKTGGLISGGVVSGGVAPQKLGGLSAESGGVPLQYKERKRKSDETDQSKHDKIADFSTAPLTVNMVQIRESEYKLDADLWNSALGYIGPEDQEQWFNGVTPLGFKDSEFWIAVSTGDFTRRWILQNFGGVLERNLGANVRVILTTDTNGQQSVSSGIAKAVNHGR